MSSTSLKIIVLLLTALHISCEVEDLSVANENFKVTTDGATLPVYVRGNVSSGTLILVLHGGPGGNGIEYSLGSYADRLAEKFGMVYFDQRGQGMSQGKYDDSSLTISQFTKDVFAIITTIKAKYGTDKKIVLFGHSWGGMLGTAFLLDPAYQSEVAGWMQANGAYDVPLLNKLAVVQFKKVALEQMNKRNSVEKWRDILDWASKIDTSRINARQSEEINQRAFVVENYLISDLVINPTIGGFDSRTYFFGSMNWITSALTGSRTNRKLSAEIEATSYAPRLDEIVIPSLFLYSTYDFITPVELGQLALARSGASNKKLVVFENSGHVPMDSEPSRFVNEVTLFVNSLP